jgi:hypothetical protein
MEDPRLRCFSVSASGSTTSSRADTLLRRSEIIKVHGEKCAFCGCKSSRTVKISIAHLVSFGSDPVDFSYFGAPWYSHSIERWILREISFHYVVV